MNALLPMMVAGLLVTGMGLALLGSIKVSLARKLNIDEARVGGLVSMFGFAMIPVIFTTGFLTDELDKQWLLAGGSILMIVGLITLAKARNYGTALIAAAGSENQQQPLDVRIRSDRTVPYEVIEPLLLACARSGVTRVKFPVLQK